MLNNNEPKGGKSIVRVCFVIPTNFYLTPYLKMYTDILNKHNVEYDIIFWNRYEIDESIGEKNIYAFNKSMDEFSPKAVKFAGYSRFGKFTKKILKKNEYNRVFIMGTVLGVFLYPFLIREYSNKYILDIRDYSYENNKIFYKIEKKLIKGSLMTVISSEGYKNFLPPHEYVLVHNILDWHNLDKLGNNDKKRSSTIRIVYLGLVRFFEQDKKLITKLANDPRFHISYIGKNADKLKKFIKDNNIKNVTLEPKLSAQDTMQYYVEADVINNLYGNNTPVLDYALSNKLYHAAQMKMPILVCPNTYMEEISCKYDFGITVDLENESIADELYDKYNKINWDELNAGCIEFLEKVYSDNLKFEGSIIEVVKG